MTTDEPRPRASLRQTIAATLRAEIANGIHRPGDQLPTEAELSRRFGVNRHTVRAALAALAAEGLVNGRRGAGVFVTAASTDYPLGRRVRMNRALLAAGRTPRRDLLLLDTRRASPAEAEALALSGPEPMVHVYEALSFADEAPISLGRSVFPAARLPDLPAELARRESVTAALAACGVADYTRASTRITAVAASAIEAAHLRLSVGAPLLRTVSVNIDLTRAPIEYGRTVFAGDRVTLTLTDSDDPAASSRSRGGSAPVSAAERPD